MNPDKPAFTGDRRLAKPRLLITIDVEGDNLWSKPRTITTRNADFLPRFQQLCESYGLRPTYLTNYEMATCPSFQEFAQDILAREVGEIGMHLHAWNTPPAAPLTADDFLHQPYLTEYSEGIMREKIAVTTRLLEDTFGVRIISHRAGRWGFNETYARILVEMGYRVDCSVTPHISWKRNLGDPTRNGGPNYSGFPEYPYFIDLGDVSCPGDSPLLEVPLTTLVTKRLVFDQIYSALNDYSLAYRGLRRFALPVHKFVPNGKNRQQLLRIIDRARRESKSCVELMLHSSELMPGGSPTFPTTEHIEALYEDLGRIFSEAEGGFVGATLKDFYEDYRRARRREGSVRDQR